jgi:hypothetical protein
VIVVYIGVSMLIWNCCRDYRIGRMEYRNIYTYLHMFVLADIHTVEPEKHGPDRRGPMFIMKTHTASMLPCLIIRPNAMVTEERRNQLCHGVSRSTCSAGMLQVMSEQEVRWSRVGAKNRTR